MRLPSPPPPSAPPCAQVLPGLWLDGRAALWIPAERILAVADLHWGYAATHRARGNLLPAWGDDDIEQRLDGLVRDYAPAEMIWLGDIVHATEGAERATRYLRTARVRVTLLAGNHDRRWVRTAETLTFAQAVQRGGCFFHHGDQEQAVPAGTIEIVGHHHPSLVWSDQAGGRVKVRALIARADRVILPAFSPWAAGMPWNDRLAAGDIPWIITPQRIFAFSRTARPVSAAV